MLLFVVATLIGLAVPAAAQDWPANNITVIVPLGAGSATDVMTRVVMDQVGKQLGRTIVVENRPGAGGTIGANVVAKSAPDGYTVLAYGALSIANALYSKIPYDTLRDFVPVIGLGQQPLAVVTSPGERLQDARRPDRGGEGEARARSTTPRPASARRRISAPSGCWRAPESRSSTSPSRGPRKPSPTSSPGAPISASSRSRCRSRSSTTASSSRSR